MMYYIGFPDFYKNYLHDNKLSPKNKVILSSFSRVAGREFKKYDTVVLGDRCYELPDFTKIFEYIESHTK